MAIFRSCCYWRTAYASGLYTFVYFIISTISISLLLNKERAFIHDEQNILKLKDPKFDVTAARTICPTAIVVFNVMMLSLASFGVISSISMCIGIYKHKRLMLFPWISVMTIDIFVEFSHFIYVLIFEKVERKLPTMLIFCVDFFVIILHICCLLCVVSQYQRLYTPNINDVHSIPFSQASKNCLEEKDREINCAMKSIQMQSDLKCAEDIIWSEQEYFESC